MIDRAAVVAIVAVVVLAGLGAVREVIARPFQLITCELEKVSVCDLTPDEDPTH